MYEVRIFIVKINQARLLIFKPCRVRIFNFENCVTGGKPIRQEGKSGPASLLTHNKLLLLQTRWQV
jgi:hypothetical protein